MSDIDYHSIYTQFVTEKCNGVRVNAIITKGYLGKTSTPCNQINVYQIVPSTVSDNMLKSMEYNSKHPIVHSYYAITSAKNLPVETIALPKKNPTYSDIFAVLNPTSVNIILYDCVILDQVWTDYMRHIEPNTFGVLSSKHFKKDIPLDVSVFSDNSEYTYDIDNFNGFVVYGKPSFDTPYYPNVFGSKHMLIKKFYSMKQNIVNLANTIPCYFLEQNSDYSLTDSYIPVPSFSLMIIQPQTESSNPELIVDEEDMFKDRDPTPLDVDISFDNIQLSIEDYVPFVKRVELSTIEHELKRKFYKVYQEDCTQKLSFNTEKQLCSLRELDEKVESIRKEQFTKLDEDYKAKTKELVTKYSHMQEQLQRELDAIRETKTKEIDDRVNAEMDVLRSKKIIEVENETKNMYELLDAKYSTAQKERQVAIGVYEKNEHDRIDKEIRSLYDKKHEELMKHIGERRSKLENEINMSKASTLAKIESDLRKEYSQKYNDEYIKSLAQLMSTVESKRNTAMVLLEKEMNGLKQHKINEIESWEHKQKAKTLEHVASFENEQRSHVSKLISDFYTAQLELTNKQIHAHYTQESEKIKNKIQKETDDLRIQKLSAISSSVNDVLTSKLAALETELNTLKHEKISQMNIELDHEKQMMVKELSRFEETEKSEIASRLSAFEESERQELIHQREQEVDKQIRIMRELREQEMSNHVNERMAAVNLEIARKESEQHKLLHERKHKAVQEVETFLKEEESKLAQHKQLFIQKLKSEEARLREDAISARQVYIESEIADMRERYSKQVQKEYETELENIKLKLEKDKKEYAHTLDAVKVLLQDKQTAELDAWAENERSKRKLQLESEYHTLELNLKELYEIKKFEYADAFTKEMTELEKSRIHYHAREQSRLAQELVKIKEKAIDSIDADVDTIKKVRVTEIENELSELYAKRVKEVEDRVVAETDTIFHTKIKEIEERLELIAMERVNERMEKRKQELDAEYESQKLEKLKQADEHISAIRESALSEVQTEIDAIKEKKNAELKLLEQKKHEDLEKEIQTIREQKLQELQKKLEEEQQENERRRKAKIREMEELVSRLHS